MPSKHMIGEALTVTLQTSERASQIKIHFFHVLTFPQTMNQSAKGIFALHAIR